MRRFLIFMCFGLGALTLSGQVLTDSNKAFDLSNEYRKPVFLMFSGSDWCAPCIRFEKNVLADTAFCDFASRNLVLLNADFPQRKRLTEETIRQNEALARAYNPEGIFPYFLLLRPDRSILQRFTYLNESPADLISRILTCIDHETAQGVQGSR